MYDYKVPTPEEIDELTRQARQMRAQAIRTGVHGFGRAISNAFHRLFARPAHG